MVRHIRCFQPSTTHPRRCCYAPRRFRSSWALTFNRLHTPAASPLEPTFSLGSFAHVAQPSNEHGVDKGVAQIGGTAIVAPYGELRAVSFTLGDEIVALQTDMPPMTCPHRTGRRWLACELT